MSHGHPERTTSDLYRLALRAPFLRSGGRPYVSSLNFFTGFGKTHEMASFSIELFCLCDTIPVFLAPLQSLVSAFEGRLKIEMDDKTPDRLKSALESVGGSIPVYRVYSIEYLKSDRGFFEGVSSFASWMLARPDLVDQFSAPRGGRPTPQAEGQAYLDVREMRSKADRCAQWSAPSASSAEDSLDYLLEANRELYRALADETYTLAVRFTRRAIVHFASKAARGSPDLFSDAGGAGAALGLDPRSDGPLLEIAQRLFPMQLFLERPGVILTTSAKASSQVAFFACDATTGKLKWHNHGTLFSLVGGLNDGQSHLGRSASRRPGRPAHDRGVRAVLFIDESEESYWHMFEQRSSVINQEAGLDLNRVISEFVDYFDSTWPLGIADCGKDWMAESLFGNLEHFAAACPLASQRCQAEMVVRGVKLLPADRAFAIYKAALAEVNAELAQRWRDDYDLRLVWEHLYNDAGDAHAKFERLLEKARIHTALRELLTEIAPAGLTPFDTYRAIVRLTVGKKFFIMGRCSYGEVLDQPHQTFFTSSGQVMSSSFLHRIELRQAAGEQTVRIVYHDNVPSIRAITLYHYLRLVVFIAASINDAANPVTIRTPTPAGSNDPYRLLRRFKGQTSHIFRSRITLGGLQTDFDDSALVPQDFFYEQIKNVVTLEESRSQADEYNRERDICLTVTIHSLDRTPEDDIQHALGSRNGVVLASATGGLDCASSGDFNPRRLRSITDAAGGSLYRMDDEQLQAVRTRREQSLAARERRCIVFEESTELTDLSCSPAFRELRSHIVRALTDDEGEPHLTNAHKRHEIAVLAAALDRLITSDTRSALALCQTPAHFRDALLALAKLGARSGLHSDSLVRVVERGGAQAKEGHLFEIHAGRLSSYRALGFRTKVVVAVYTAEAFRKTPGNKVGQLAPEDDEAPFDDDLVKALDISGGKKILLCSAYQSASRGINFVTREDGKERDFELFALVNDPFYTRHTRTGTRGFRLTSFQSFLQALIDKDDAAMSMSYRQLLATYNSQFWPLMTREHFIDITRLLFQAIGRSERRVGVDMPRGQEFWIGTSATRSIHLGLRHMGEIVGRASAAQSVVIDAIARHNDARILFPAEHIRRAHEVDSVAKAVAMSEFTDRVPKKMRTDAASRTLWARLFREEMFTDPAGYIQALREAGVSRDYCDGAYLRVPADADLYLKTVRLGGRSVDAITDSVDGSSPYEWASMIAPHGMMASFSPKVQSLIRSLRNGVACPADTDGRPMRLVPQPWFVREILRGYFGEIAFEDFMQAHVAANLFSGVGELLPHHSPVRLFQAESETQEAALYQLYDYFLEREDGTLIAVDVKNWSRTADLLLSAEQLTERAEEKYERLRSLFPMRRIRCLYVNLHGANKESSRQKVQGDIRFASLFVVISPRGFNPWAANLNLANLILNA